MAIVSETKVCSKCKEVKNTSCFYIDKSKKNNLASQCKICSSEGNKQRHKLNPLINIQRASLWNKINKEKRNRRMNESNKLPENKTKRHLQYLKRKNKLDYKKKTRNYMKRYQENINNKLKSNLRHRINMAIKNNFKNSSAVRDLGCSIDELKVWLEQRFYLNSETGEKMTWKNYGQWHIDHIVPLFSFDLTDRKQFLKANHWFNLRPL